MPSTQKSQAWPPAPHRVSDAYEIFNLGTQEMEVEGLEGYPELHSKLEVSLGYVRPHLKK